MKKNKVLIIVFLLSIIILTTIISVTFSKYAIERKDTHILESDAFYFNSSLTQQEYQLNEWNGKDVQNIKFNVKNYLDNMQITEQDIKYDIKAQITNEDAQLVNLELKDENGSIVTTKEESDTENTTFTVSGLTLKADTTAEQILTTNNYSISISPKNSELEEERRLCYVAITRAKKKLYLVNARRRTLFGREQVNPPSRFIGEINNNLIHSNVSEENKTIPKIDTEGMFRKEDIDYQVGDYVYHESFGTGRVVEVTSTLVSVAFKHPYGIKKLMKNHKKLSKV